MDRKQRLRLIYERNKRNQLIFQHADQHRQNVEAEREAQALTPPPPPSGDEEVVWSAQTQNIRNRLTGRKRMARDRWNRFAGTAESGGMGR